MKQKIILLLLATLTPIGIFTRFEYLLFLSFLLFILFSVTCLNNNFENNLKILKNKFNLALAIVFIIVAISYYNPNYKVLEANGYYTLDKLSHIALLPTSVKSSVGNKGLIYFVLFWINMFYFVNAILLNATNKKNAFLFIICTNIIGAIAAIYLIWEEYYFFKEGIIITGKKLFGLISSPYTTITGSFLSKNAASQYFSFMLMLSLGLFFHTFKEKQQRYYLFMLLYILEIILFIIALFLCKQAQSFIGIACCLFLGIIYAVYLFYRRYRKYFYIKALIISIIFILGLTYTYQHATTTFEKIKTDIKSEFVTTISELNSEESTRPFIWKKAICTLKTHRLWGIGANNFIFYSNFINKKGRCVVAYSAHSDPLQLFVEFGIIGGIIILTLFCYGMIIIYNRLHTNKIGMFCYMGICYVLAISFFDMPFQQINVALLIFGTIASLCKIDTNATSQIR